VGLLNPQGVWESCLCYFTSEKKKLPGAFAWRVWSPHILVNGQQFLGARPKKPRRREGEACSWPGVLPNLKWRRGWNDSGGKIQDATPKVRGQGRLAGVGGKAHGVVGKKRNTGRRGVDGIRAPKLDHRKSSFTCRNRIQTQNTTAKVPGRRGGATPVPPSLVRPSFHVGAGGAIRPGRLFFER